MLATPAVPGSDHGADLHRWSWIDALAAAHPGGRYRVTALLYSGVRDRCRELGCAEGEEFLCVDKHDGALVLERSDGSRLRLEREYAWFVEVERIDRPSGA